MKVQLLSKVGPHEAGTILEVNDNMFIHLTHNHLAQKAIEKVTEKDGRRFVKSATGNMIDVTTVSENKAIEKAPENKAIKKAPKNK